MYKKTLVTLAGTLLVFACQSTPKGTGTANELTAMSAELREASTTMAGVVKTLNAVAKPGADMAKAFSSFEDAADRMTSQESRIRSLRASVETKKTDYLNTWQENIKAINDATLRQRAEQRRDDVVKRLQALGKQGEGLRASYDKWMTDVADVRKYLKTDLNPGGVESAADIIQRVNQGAASLEKGVGDLAGELDKISDAIAAAKPPES